PSYPSCLLNLSSLRELSLSNLYATKPTAIADQLGYSDQSALARAYKNLTGQTLLTRKKQLQLIQKNATK
ncbi:hypothetical protein ABTK81_05425, partial [Acinetobacter baumannii]